MKLNLKIRGLVAAFLLVLAGAGIRLYANTPEEGAAALVNAMQTSDPGLWYRQLSQADVDQLHEMIGSYQKTEFEKEKADQEKELGIKIRDIYEFKGGELALVLRPYSSDNNQEHILDLFFIKDISVWNGRYAEMTVFLPIMIRGVLPPLRLSFVKEKENWKFCQALSTAYFMYGNRTAALNDFVNMYLDLFMGIKLDRADTSRMKKKEFRLPQEQSDKYLAAWKNIDNITAKDFLAIWILTGDKNALQAWEKEKAAGKKTLTDKEVEIAQRSLTGEQPGAQYKTPLPAVEAERYLMFVKSAFYRDILAYKKYMAKFSGEENWLAKASYQLAENYEYAREYSLAAKVYLQFIAKYPKAEDSVKAQSNLAKLYWDKLGKQSEAVKIWKELDARGKLPSGTPYKTAGSVVPKTLVQRSGDNVQGISDFDVSQEGKWVDVLYTFYTKENRESISSFQTSKLIRYQENGGSRELRALKSGYGNIQRVADTIWLFDTDGNGRALNISSNGVPLRRIRDDGKYLQEIRPLDSLNEIPSLQDVIQKIGHRHVSIGSRWRGAYFTGNSIYAYNADNGRAEIKKFDLKTGKLNSESVLSPKAELLNYSSRILPTENGGIFAVSPEGGVVYAYDGEGRAINTIRDVPAGVQFKNIRDIAFDKDGNMYAALEGSHQIAIFSKNGSLLNSFTDDSMTPTSLAVDSAGNIYVSGYGSTMGGTTVKVYDRSGKALKLFDTQIRGQEVANVGVKDLAVLDDGYVYVRVDKIIERFNMKGEQVDSWVIPDFGHDRILFAGDAKRKRLYVLKGLDVYEYDGPKTRKVYTLQLPEKPYSPVRMITAFAADRSGELRGYVSNIGTFSFDPDKISGTTVILSISGAKYGSQISPTISGFDSDGNIWFWNSDGYGKTPTIEKYDLSGKELLRIPEAQGARSLWNPIDIAKYGRGELLIADSTNRRIAKYSMAGKYLGDFDLKPYLSGWLQRIRVDSKGRLYILSSEMSGQVILRFEGDLFKRAQN